MKINSYLICFFLLCSLQILAQTSDTLNGQVMEEGSNFPLEGVNIFNQTSNIGVASESDGSFQIEIKQYPTTLIFSYLGYENYLIEIKNPAAKPIAISMVRSTFGLPEVEITDQPKIEKLTKDKFTVKDFIIEKDKILLLTFKNFRSNNILKLQNWNGEIINEVEIEKVNVDRLHRSCLGNIHLVGEKMAYEISIVNDNIQLISKYPSQQFEDLIAPCITTSEDYLYRKEYKLKNQLLTYNVVSKKEKEITSKIHVIDRKNLSRSKDDFRLRLEFGPDFPRPLSWEQRRAWQSLVYQPLFSPLINLGEELCLFNHTLGYLEFYTFVGKNKRIVPITYHENRKWQKLILFDKKNNTVYTVYDKRKGKMIYEIDLKSGQANPVLFFECSLIEKIEIHNGYLFFLQSGATQDQKNRILHRIKLDQ